MKAISLWQPWASLWCCSLLKLHETRSWPISVPAGGVWVAVHAAQHVEKNFGSPAFATMLQVEFGADWRRTLPTGAIIGAVHVAECRPTHEVYPVVPEPQRGPEAFADFLSGDYTPGRYAWRCDERRVLPQPIPYRGLQKLFTLHGDAADALAKLVGQTVPQAA